ncbi:hypothetical protein HMPREF0239_00142 [Clostridium sp. ATCC BAA-442]|nr:hypothetical protein HMPREF0239_00142 [Clostridium sp. ATCC BAA-442]
MTLSCDSPHFSFHLYLPAPPAGAPRNRNPQATPCGSRLRQE